MGRARSRLATPAERVAVSRSRAAWEGARIDVSAEPPLVPQSQSELERFFDLSLDLLVIAGFGRLPEAGEPGVSARARLSHRGAACQAEAGRRAPRRRRVGR